MFSNFDPVSFCICYADCDVGTKHDIRDVFFQDPAFNAIDETFLEGLGYTVLVDPAAFAMIDDRSFVFAPHLEVAQTSMSLEKSTPALFIGNNLDGYVNG